MQNLYIKKVLYINVSACEKGEDFYMNAKLYISKNNLKYNIEYIKDKIGNRNIIAMVKANAYGLGDKLISKELEKLGVNAFGVANVYEGIHLRESGINNAMILVTCVSVGDEIEYAIENNISLSVSDIDNIREISSIAIRKNKIAKIHIKLDTGMTRLGFNKDNIIINFTNILKYQNIYVEGIYTHLSCADTDIEYTKEQINEFEDIVTELSKVYGFEYIHILNSDGTEDYNSITTLDTHVRVGISMYGYSKNMKPVSKLTAPVIHISNIDKYAKVGYGGTYIAKPNTKIAVIKIGYADGISRSLSNKLKVNINNVECNQVGNICMDMMMVDVTNVDLKINDEVTLWDYNNDLKEIADCSNKIVYEVISNLGNRIERIME